MKINIASQIRNMIEAEVSERGYILWDVTFEKEGKDFNLVISLDSETGISIDDCQAVTDLINPILDSTDLIDFNYCLEVSSAGLSRALRLDYHLSLAAEKKLPVTVKLFTAMDGQKQYSGIINRFDDDNIILDDDIKFERKKIAKITAEF